MSLLLFEDSFPASSKMCTCLREVLVRVFLKSAGDARFLCVFFPLWNVLSSPNSADPSGLPQGHVAFFPPQR